MILSSFEEITKSKPEKSLTSFIKKKGGRNNTGKITVRHQGGGHKQLYRLIDFNTTDKQGIEGTVKAIEYDPNRNAYITLVYYNDGEKRYHLAPQNIEVGSKIITKEKGKIKSGNRMMLKNIPVGLSIFNIEIVKGKGGQLVRSAGSYATLVSLDGPNAQIQMPSGEVRYIDKNCYSTIGVVSNSDYSNTKLGKAGRSRWRGIRPVVRGKAMNPCDHPHGGGEGCCPIGHPHPMTPWGKPALGVKTRRKHKYSNKSIIKRRK
jgi:large subunit ribosomal protein L2